MKIIPTPKAPTVWPKFIFLLLLFTITSEANGQEKIKPEDSTRTHQLSEEKFILVNGIEHWVTIKGDRSKPAILFLHGGPGSPLSPYSDQLYKEWEEEFIVVQWDQRGTGKTFGKYAPEELTPEFLLENPLSLDLMTNDGIQLSEYLISYLGKQKIILFGTSWGSSLGVKMALKKPELFYAYVGHAQLVNPVIDLDFYTKIYKMAESNHDQEALETLTAIGKPPYDRARKVGQLYRVIKKYEGMNSTPAPDDWFALSPEYDNDKDNQNRMDGDDYSFVNFTGDSVLGVKSMSATIDLMQDNLNFEIPVYLIQGEEDILTPKEKTEEFYNKLKAPKKDFVLLPKTAHGFNQSVLDAQFKLFRSIEIW